MQILNLKILCKCIHKCRWFIHCFVWISTTLFTIPVLKWKIICEWFIKKDIIRLNHYSTWWCVKNIFNSRYSSVLFAWPECISSYWAWGQCRRRNISSVIFTISNKVLVFIYLNLNSLPNVRWLRNDRNAMGRSWESVVFLFHELNLLRD